MPGTSETDGDSLRRLLHSRPALCLDFDGLLVDSEPLHYESFRRAFGRFGHKPDPQEYWLHFTHLGEGVEGELRRHPHLADLPLEVIQRDKTTIFSALCQMDPPVPRPGALRLLEALHELRWPYTIASNTDRADIARMLVHLGQGASLPIVGGDGRPGKPRPDIYLAAAAALGLAPQRCLAVEDTLKGVQAAAAAGMPCVAVPGPQTAGFAFPGAAVVLSGLEPLAQALLELA